MKAALLLNLSGTRVSCKLMFKPKHTSFIEGRVKESLKVWGRLHKHCLFNQPPKFYPRGWFSVMLYPQGRQLVAWRAIEEDHFWGVEWNASAV